MKARLILFLIVLILLAHTLLFVVIDFLSGNEITWNSILDFNLRYYFFAEIIIALSLIYFSSHEAEKIKLDVPEDETQEFDGIVVIRKGLGLSQGKTLLTNKRIQFYPLPYSFGGDRQEIELADIESVQAGKYFYMFPVAINIKTQNQETYRIYSFQRDEFLAKIQELIKA